VKAVRVLIAGRVQGVGFRWAVKREAGRLGVDGWVRNLSDGRVEVWFEGDDAPVDEVVGYCREGPDTARVESVSVTDVEPERSGVFRVR